jgi:hypothetical protein
MVPQLKSLMKAVATVTEKAFLAEPSHTRTANHLSQPRLQPGGAQSTLSWNKHVQVEAVAGLSPEPTPGAIEVIKNSKLEVIGYRETRESCQILRDKNGHKLGTYDHARKITWDRRGHVIGLNTNQLLRLL